MTWTSRFCKAVFPAAFLLLLALNAWAQTASSGSESARPKKAKFKAEVLAMTRVAITVRSRDNFNHVRTFTYAQKLATEIAKMIDRNRPFQHGDRVEIIFIEGSDKALKIKGKPGQRR